MFNQVYYGRAKLATNIVPPQLWGDIDPMPAYEYSIEKAKEELSKVTLPEGFVTEVWAPNFGRPYMQEPGKVAEYIKDQLQKIGLQVKIQMFEKAAYTKKINDNTHPICLLGWSADFPDPDNFMNSLLHGKFKDTSLDISFFDNETFNKRIDEAAITSDKEKRKTLYKQAAEIYRAELPSIAFVHTPKIYAVRNNIDYKPHPVDHRIFTTKVKK